MKHFSFIATMNFNEIASVAKVASGSIIHFTPTHGTNSVAYWTGTRLIGVHTERKHFEYIDEEGWDCFQEDLSSHGACERGFVPFIELPTKVVSVLQPEILDAIGEPYADRKEARVWALAYTDPRYLHEKIVQWKLVAIGGRRHVLVGKNVMLAH